MQYFDTIKFNW